MLRDVKKNLKTSLPTYLMEKYDFLIIGAGGVGLAAAMYSAYEFIGKAKVVCGD